jgi:UTP--glucose-1-phosphate uridylyltransferase
MPETDPVGMNPVGVTPSDGRESRGNVRKAVIPAAGLGTRMFPASKAMRKEMFPIVDRDGLAKPAILLIVEEAVEAGVDSVFIVVREEDRHDYESFFHDEVPRESFDRLPGPAQECARKILDIGRKVRFLIQHEQEGFGHAVHCAREAIGGEPFLLMLGDHLWRSETDRPCARQLLDAFDRQGLSLLSLIATPEAEIGRFGTVTGKWLEPRRLLEIAILAEKPSIEEARSRLRVPGYSDAEYLTLFGQYVLKPTLFDHLDAQIRAGARERGEFDLTRALDRLREEDGLLGLVTQGKRFDIGLPASYAETLRTFREEP